MSDLSSGVQLAPLDRTAPNVPSQGAPVRPGRSAFDPSEPSRVPMTALPLKKLTRRCAFGEEPLAGSAISLDHAEQ